MKALIFETPNKPVIADVPMPTINDTEVLVRTRTIGICHSDYELLAGRYIIPISYPVIPGHQWCGEIVEVGKAVKNFKVGDGVVGECVVRTPERLHHFGFSMNGADRQYFNVNPDWLHKLPDLVMTCAARARSNRSPAATTRCFAPAEPTPLRRLSCLVAAPSASFRRQRHLAWARA